MKARTNFMDVRQPPGFEWMPDEPPFEPAKHLQLEEPQRKWILRDFGYSEEEIKDLPFDLAMTEPFRVLSHEGVAVLKEVVKRLRAHSRSCDRIANFVRGGVYRSKFLRDLCGSPDVAAFTGEIAGAEVLPHTMPLYQGHINLIPEDRQKDVDRWHLDTVSLDYVLLVTDPAEFDGGDFEYFAKTKTEATSALAGANGEEDLETVRVRFPEAGFAVLQQGNMVVHRARKVIRGDDRATLVNSYVPADLNQADVSKLIDCKPVDPPDILFTEWARHKAYLSQRKLEQLIRSLPYTEDREAICRELRRAVRDVQTAIMEISDESDGRLVFFGGDALTDPKI